jgi:hypothetical protein
MEKAKPYEIILEDRGKYLYALVKGDVLKPEIAKQYWDEIAEKAFDLRLTRILIEKDFSETVSAPEMLEMGDYLGKLLATKRVAFLDRHENIAINNLGEKIAINRGVNMKVFQEVAEAEEWLTSS